MRFLASTVVAGLAATTCAQKVKVMLLGDSITEISCWRPLVWNQLTSAGLANNVDFVGSMSNLQGKCSRPAGFDPNHEGHSGWQAYDIARNNIVGWVQNTKPDIVQFMLGTNDVNIGKRNVQSILDSYTTMLNAMRAANPRVKVIIDKLIPTSWSDATIEAVNNAIPGWVQTHTTSQSPIVIADCSRAAGFTNNMLEGDGVHPNSQGDQFLARQIGPKLIQFIDDVQGGSGSPSTTVPTPTPATTLSTITTSSPQPTGGNCAALYGQCGGQGFQGPTCCSQGTCRASNQWYSQCL
ncbi:SGNH hydrolase-type esterase domain-containing protein [Apiosordaria backusii]|uniref:SGNH hydrolase-type esterase domain-containing protein n=1 Tax=Apiosordaria backusii TaxID=314023 RepID=A0AA40EA62_9PEZI|nr:SGNH hydrolase-type esterase domain-containing protein [Apiosordaria backusii]